MKLYSWCCLALFLAPAALPAEESTAAIDRLIEQLSSPRFSERERAFADLEQAGLPALEALKRATAGSDAETSRRAAELVRRLEEKRATAELLAPKTVRLNVKDVSVAEALGQLSAQSGYNLQLEGAAPTQKITLDTGETTFWKALDQLAREAKLVPARAGSKASPAPSVDKRIPIQQIAPVAPRVAPVPGLAPQLQADPPADGKAQAEQIKKAVEEAAAKAKEVAEARAQAAQRLQNQMAGALQQAGMPATGTTAGATGTIVLRPGQPEQQLVSYADAVRVTVRPVKSAARGQAHFTLEALAEPRLQNFTLVGTPVVQRAIDNLDQVLMPIAWTEEPAAPMPQQFGRYQPVAIKSELPLRLETGEKPATALKELVGTLSATATLQDQLLAEITDVMKGEGKTVDARNGGSVSLRRITKQANGDIQVEVALENMGNRVIGNQVVVQQVVIRGNAGIINAAPNVAQQANLPQLFDAKGGKYVLNQILQNNLRVFNGQASNTLLLQYRRTSGVGDPHRLALVGQRQVTIPVEFRFENVPLQ